MRILHSVIFMWMCFEDHCYHPSRVHQRISDDLIDDQHLNCLKTAQHVKRTTGGAIVMNNCSYIIKNKHLKHQTV